MAIIILLKPNNHQQASRFDKSTTPFFGTFSHALLSFALFKSMVDTHASTPANLTQYSASKFFSDALVSGLDRFIGILPLFGGRNPTGCAQQKAEDLVRF